MLTDPAVAQRLFNPEQDNPGILRRIIIQEREKTALQQFYQNNIKIKPGEGLEPVRPSCVSHDDIEPAMAYYEKTHQGRPMPTNGDMLESEEIMRLINLQRKNDNVIGRALHPETVSVHTVESSTPEELDVLGEIKDLRDQIQQRELPKQQKIHAFVLGNTNQFTQSEGHWVTMILEFARNRRRYTIANSAHNDISMFDGACHNVIRYLEGDRVAALLQPSESFKQKLTQELQSALEHYEENPNDQVVRCQLHNAHEKFDKFVKDYSDFGGKENFDSLLNLF